MSALCDPPGVLDALEAFGFRMLRTATNTSPFGATSMCLGDARESAKRVAQKPAGSLRPALSAAHAGAWRESENPTTETAPVTTTSKRVNRMALHGKRPM